MKKFWLKIITLVSLIIISIAIVFLLPFVLPSNPSRFLAQHINKRKLAASTEDPRIIIVGGSNVAFSTNSQLIEKITGYNVVNFGLEGSLGLRLMLEDLKNYTRKEDVIVLSPEYEHFSTVLNGDGADLIGIISADPIIMKDFSSFKQVENIYPYILMLIKIEITDTIVYIRKSPQNTCENPGFCNYNFDSYGDEVAHLKKPAPGFNDTTSISKNGPSPETIQVIEDYLKFSNKVGAHVYYSFPPVAEEQFKRDEPEINKIFDALKKINSLTVIDKPNDYVFPNNMFYDQKYHLQGPGREERSRKLAEAISKYLLKNSH